MFYFIVSNINTIITKYYQQNRQKSKDLQMLFRCMKEHQLPQSLVKKAKKGLNSKCLRMEEVQAFTKQFKQPLKTSLDFYLYYPILKQFSFLEPLEKNILANIGQHLNTITHTKGNTANQLLITRKCYFYQEFSISLFIFTRGGKNSYVVRGLRWSLNQHILERNFLWGNRNIDQQ